MIRAELIRTCSNARVASAALASIGCGLRARIELLANASGLERGQFVARIVRNFAEHASEAEMATLDAAMMNQDMPLLAGLRHIVEIALNEKGARSFATRRSDKAHCRAA